MSGRLGQDQEWTASWARPWGEDDYRQAGASDQYPGRFDSRIDGSNYYQIDTNNTPRWLPAWNPLNNVPAQRPQSASVYAHGRVGDQRPDFKPSFIPQSNLQPALTKVIIQGPNLMPATNETASRLPSTSQGLPAQIDQLSVSVKANDPPKHVKVTRTRQTSQGNVPFTYTTPATIRYDMQSVSDREHRLYASFKRSPRPRKFFVVGKVFLTLWAEPAGEGNSSAGSTFTANTSGISTGTYGERVFSKIRRFIVVREGSDSCTALPIKTYGGVGVAKKNVRKSDHAIIYTGKEPPPPRPDEAPARGEYGLLPQAVRVDGDDPAQKLDVMSRVDFGKVYTIEHNVKVRSMGKVNRAYEQPLLYQLQRVWASTMGVSPTREIDEKGGPTSTNALPSSQSVLGWIDVYNTLIASGWTEGEARSVLKNNLPPIPEHSNMNPTEANRKTALKAKRQSRQDARPDTEAAVRENNADTQDRNLFS